MVVVSRPDEMDFFNLPNPSSCTMALVLIQPLTEMSTRNLPGDKGCLVCKADNLTAVCDPTVGASTSHNCMGLNGLLQELRYLQLLHTHNWISQLKTAKHYMSTTLNNVNKIPYSSTSPGCSLPTMDDNSQQIQYEAINTLKSPKTQVSHVK
jgi:hypothetical protein